MALTIQHPAHIAEERVQWIQGWSSAADSMREFLLVLLFISVLESALLCSISLSAEGGMPYFSVKLYAMINRMYSTVAL